jgi:hypothetical protein
MPEFLLRVVDPMPAAGGKACSVDFERDRVAVEPAGDLIVAEGAGAEAAAAPVDGLTEYGFPPSSDATTEGPTLPEARRGLSAGPEGSLGAGMLAPLDRVEPEPVPDRAASPGLMVPVLLAEGAGPIGYRKKKSNSVNWRKIIELRHSWQPYHGATF